MQQTPRVLTLDRGNYTTATIHTHCGAITSWRINENEMLHIMNASNFDEICTIRGGSILAFPYYGHSASGPEDGFAKYIPWKVLTLDRGNYTTATIHVHGGTLLSWRVEENEILYLKKKTNFDEMSPIRGGSKFAFPYYGHSQSGPEHGFARYVPWKVEKWPTKLENGDVQAVISLEQTALTESIWNFKFKITNQITLCQKHIKMDVKVQNTCQYFPMQFNLQEITVLNVNHIDDVEIENVSTSKYADWNKKVYYKPGEKLTLNEKENLKIDRAHRSIFFDVPGDITIKNIRPGIHLKFSSSIKDFMVHNGWTTTMINQHIAGEHLKYLGCGYGCIGKAKRLLPQETWEYYRYIECIDEEYDRRKEELLNKLSNLNDIIANYCGH